MEPNGTKPPQAAAGVHATMREMMERMCGTADWNPVETCRRMMASTGPTTGTAAKAAPERGASVEENGRGAEHEGPRPCCGPRSRCAPG